MVRSYKSFVIQDANTGKYVAKIAPDNVIQYKWVDSIQDASWGLMVIPKDLLEYKGESIRRVSIELIVHGGRPLSASLKSQPAQLLNSEEWEKLHGH